MKLTKTNKEVKQLLQEVIILINYCGTNKIKNIILNTMLFRNFDLLDATSKIIDKSVSQELKDLEEKVLKLIENTDNNFYQGIKRLSTEEQLRHTELKEQYEKDMLEEIEIDLFLIDVEKIENVEFDTAESQILNHFLK